MCGGLQLGPWMLRVGTTLWRTGGWMGGWVDGWPQRLGLDGVRSANRCCPSFYFYQMHPVVCCLLASLAWPALHPRFPSRFCLPSLPVLLSLLLLALCHISAHLPVHPPARRPGSILCSNTEEVIDQPKLLRPPNNATLREYQIVGLQVGGQRGLSHGWDVKGCEEVDRWVDGWSADGAVVNRCGEGWPCSSTAWVEAAACTASLRRTPNLACLV